MVVVVMLAVHSDLNSLQRGQVKVSLEKGSALSHLLALKLHFPCWHAPFLSLSH